MFLAPPPALGKYCCPSTDLSDRLSAQRNLFLLPELLTKMRIIEIPIALP
jgi:hypothetical protein